jgi:hypothetical protein
MTEHSLVRMMASAKRGIYKPLSTLQKIDRLQKLHRKFEGDWIGSPWLVCPDVFCIPATMPVPEMLDAIAQHGEPCGIVGAALLHESTPPKFHVLSLHFNVKGECRKAVEASEKATWKKYIQATQQIRELHKGGGDA